MPHSSYVNSGNLDPMGSFAFGVPSDQRVQVFQQNSLLNSWTVVTFVRTLFAGKTKKLCHFGGPSTQKVSAKAAVRQAGPRLSASEYPESARILGYARPGEAQPRRFGVRRHTVGLPSSWVWLKIQQQGQTAGVGPCFRLGFHFGTATAMSILNPGILRVFRKPSKTQGKQRPVFEKRRMVEKNGIGIKP